VNWVVNYVGGKNWVIGGVLASGQLLLCTVFGFMGSIESTITANLWDL
jgi:hypothetical protein